MPWNNQGGGWQGGGGQGPWGGRPGGGQQPPDLEELLRRSQEKVKKIFPGGGGGFGGNRRTMIAVPLILLAGLAGERLLSRAAGRAGGRAAVRRVDQTPRSRVSTGTSGADRDRVHAQGDPLQPGRDRLSLGGGDRARRLGARGRQREPDADRRREHRRHQLRAAVADQGRRAVPVQHPRPGSRP